MGAVPGERKKEKDEGSLSGQDEDDGGAELEWTDSQRTR